VGVGVRAGCGTRGLACGRVRHWLNVGLRDGCGTEVGVAGVGLSEGGACCGPKGWVWQV
jgi:hypothetical protein